MAAKLPIPPRRLTGRTTITLVMPLDLWRRLEARCCREESRPAAAALDYIEQVLDECDAWDMSVQAENAS